MSDGAMPPWHLASQRAGPNRADVRWAKPTIFACRNKFPLSCRIWCVRVHNPFINEGENNKRVKYAYIESGGAKAFGVFLQCSNFGITPKAALVIGLSWP